MNVTGTSLRMGLTLVACAALASGCTSSRFGGQTRTAFPVEQANPVASSTVESRSLPPIGEDGQVVGAQDPYVFGSGDPALAGRTTNPDGSFVTLADVGPTRTASGRNLSGGLTVTKLLGAWNVSAGVDQCRLNLTQTAKSGTSRYRASTPNCLNPVLASVASWQLVGSQVQLFDEGGALIGSMLLSGDRFIGTLAGGVAISMVG